MNIKFKVNKDFGWRINNITVGTVKKDTVLTVLDKIDCETLLSNGIGWVENNSPIWKWLDIM